MICSDTVAKELESKSKTKGSLLQKTSLKQAKKSEMLLSSESKRVSDLQMLKFDILSVGLRVSEKVRVSIGVEIKEAVSMRSGLSSGLDLILPNNIWVNAPVNEWFVSQSQLELEYAEKFFISKNGCFITEVKLLRRPAFYERYTSDKLLMKAVGSIRGDRLSISLTNSCVFWKNVRKRCRFCAIGNNKGIEIASKTETQILETVEAALRDPILPAKHVYLNSGAMPTPDGGAEKFSQIIRKIKSNFAVPVHLNPCPPEREKYIDELYQSGLDEISFNIEIVNPRIAQSIIPGKFRRFGLLHYYRMLEYAVKLFGERKVSSCIVVGLEDPISTIKGVEQLAMIGVVPKLSCFRPTAGSLLSDSRPPSADLMKFVYLQSQEIVKKYGVPLGPLCAPCQLHSLVFPKRKSCISYSSEAYIK
jgi:hypothetical protein